VPRTPVAPTHLDAALRYAAAGTPVFPCHGISDGACTCSRPDCGSPGKHPIGSAVPHGLKGATTDPEVIRGWWADHPSANIGLPTGAGSGLVVVDIDRHEGLTELTARFGELPETREHQTGSGRAQLIFRHPGGTVPNATAFKGTEGIDIRGDGGYIVAPPSRGKICEYAILNGAAPAPLPERWIIALTTKTKDAQESRAGTRGEDYWLVQLQGVSEGQRNQKIIEVAGYYVGVGRRREEVEAMLIGMGAQCTPPYTDTQAIKSAIERCLLYERGKQEAKAETAETAAVGVEVNLGDVTPKEVEWVWENRLARGKLALIVGDPGVSKSTIGLDIGSRISNAREWPDRVGPAPKGNIILLTAEDDLADTVVPRVLALGGTAKAFTVLQAVKVGDRERQFSLITDLPVLEESIKVHNPVVVFIDTVNSYLGSPGGGVKVDTFKDADVRSVLLPLVKLAEKYRVAVVGIMHLNKSTQMKALYRVLGSIGYTGAARLILMAAPDPDDASGRRHFFFGEKNSNGPKAAPLAYEREGNGIRWSNQPVRDMDPDAILSGSLTKDERRAVDSARQFLEEALKDGPVEAEQMKKDAEANGLTKATLRRAKDALKVRSIRTGGIAGEGTWVWQLPRRPVTS
jgi:bifunctional DNA primase/polymerase-like protein/AAA domain-containing protein